MGAIVVQHHCGTAPLSRSNWIMLLFLCTNIPLVLCCDQLDLVSLGLKKEQRLFVLSLIECPRLTLTLLRGWWEEGREGGKKSTQRARRARGSNP